MLGTAFLLLFDVVNLLPNVFWETHVHLCWIRLCIQATYYRRTVLYVPLLLTLFLVVLALRYSPSCAQVFEPAGWSSQI